MEGSGVISEIGKNVKSLKNGDEVMFGSWGHGAIARDCTSIKHGFLKPENMLTTAAFKTVYLTAYVSLIRRGNLKDGETLLVHGASGGVGIAAVELEAIWSQSYSNRYI